MCSHCDNKSDATAEHQLTRTLEDKHPSTGKRTRKILALVLTSVAMAGFTTWFDARPSIFSNPSHSAMTFLGIFLLSILTLMVMTSSYIASWRCQECGALNISDYFTSDECWHCRCQPTNGGHGDKCAA